MENIMIMIPMYLNKKSFINRNNDRFMIDGLFIKTQYAAYKKFRK